VWILIVAQKGSAESCDRRYPDRIIHVILFLPIATKGSLKWPE
jgi:hypothetical protein